MNHFGFAIAGIAATVIVGAMVLDRTVDKTDKPAAPAAAPVVASAPDTTAPAASGNAAENTAIVADARPAPDKAPERRAVGTPAPEKSAKVAAANVASTTKPAAPKTEPASRPAVAPKVETPVVASTARVSPPPTMPP